MRVEAARSVGMPCARGGRSPRGTTTRDAKHLGVPHGVRHPRLQRACTDPAGLYEIDPATTIATNCGGRNFHWYQSYRVDLKPNNAKCCTPNVNCKDCRLNAVALASLLFRLDRFVGSIGEFRDWLDICDQYGRSNLLDSDPAWLAGEDQAVALRRAAQAMREVEGSPQDSIVDDRNVA